MHILYDLLVLCHFSHENSKNLKSIFGDYWQVQLEPTSSWALLQRNLHTPSKYTSIFQATKDIFREEGLPVFITQTIMCSFFYFSFWYRFNGWMWNKKSTFLLSSIYANFVRSSFSVTVSLLKIVVIFGMPFDEGEFFFCDLELLNVSILFNIYF